VEEGSSWKVSCTILPPAWPVLMYFVYAASAFFTSIIPWALLQGIVSVSSSSRRVRFWRSDLYCTLWPVWSTCFPSGGGFSCSTAIPYESNSVALFLLFSFLKPTLSFLFLFYAPPAPRLYPTIPWGAYLNNLLNSLKCPCLIYFWRNSSLSLVFSLFGAATMALLEWVAGVMVPEDCIRLSFSRIITRSSLQSYAVLVI